NMNFIDFALTVYLILAFLIGIKVFTKAKITLQGLYDMGTKYQYHFYIIIIIMLLKIVIDWAEDPIELMINIDFTPLMYSLEGHRVYYIQRALLNDHLTLFLSLIYIGSFMFIMTFSFSMFAYLDKRKIASDLALLNIILLFLTIPFYFLVVVYVPSYPKMLYPGASSVVSGIEPLLYNYSPMVNEWFVGYETFNNCFPSMHIGYPTAILLMMIKNIKGFRGYKIFMFSIILLIGLAIIYLGIHWLIDIAGGVLIAVIGVKITNRVSYPFWKRVHDFDKNRKKIIFPWDK
ncbi:MAG: phosphatase PAP2 family protein, partial [Thermoplasmata archaeon]|nr:phosphatase PAP2 family protein [Thermoplasmata archaeon]